MVSAELLAPIVPICSPSLLTNSCGINSTDQYKNKDSTGYTFPESCCPRKDKGMKCLRQNIYKETCNKVAIRLFKKYKHWIISCTAITLLVQLLAIVASCGIGKIAG